MEMNAIINKEITEKIKIIKEVRKFKKVTLNYDMNNILKILQIFKNNKINLISLDLNLPKRKFISNYSNFHMYLKLNEQDKIIKTLKQNKIEIIIYKNKYELNYFIIYKFTIIKLIFKDILNLNYKFFDFKKAKIIIMIYKIKVKIYLLFQKTYENFKKKDKSILIFNKIKLIVWKFLNKVNLKEKAFKFRYKILDENSFRNLKFMDDNELNIWLRHAHFKLITNSYKLNKIDEIIKWHKNNKNNKKIDYLSKQPTTIKLSSYPRHLDKKFWDNGNTYFLNCFKYEFRKNVKDYFSISDMVTKDSIVYFSEKYYSSKEMMNNDEIKLLLKNNPINIKKGMVSSGRHRVSAMIGRLIKDKSYIPFYFSKF